MSSIVISKIRQKQIADLIASGKRLDERGPTDYREIKVETGFIGKAEGSALVHIGRTKVLSGVKIELGEPFSDRPNDGVLTVNSEFVALASPEFEPGRPGEESIELARVVDRGIRESKAIDLEKLCIIPGKTVFVIFVDIYVLNHDGNLIDTAALASLAALLNTKIFNYKLKEDGEVEIVPGFNQLPVKNHPIAITFAKIDGKLIVDPWLDEEKVMDTRLTVTFDKDGKICAMQKGGQGVLTKDQTLEAISVGKQKADEIRKLVV
ncbi:MAG: exosome complex protein Rrp42 [Aigarchaeota archaeon]|nr:exosome complex protein Rrp42 [Candidatus Bathyarchaeota archaeon]MDH5703989.1 exosome complex protein Rrp42 [Aigarchaeota archaeon]